MAVLDLDSVDAQILLDAMGTGAWYVNGPEHFARGEADDRSRRFERMRRDVREIAEGN